MSKLTEHSHSIVGVEPGPMPLPFTTIDRATEKSKEAKMSEAIPARLESTFIFGVPKSGTTLLNSLLDGHPNLLVFPEEFNYLQFPLNGPVCESNVIHSMFPAKKVPSLKGETTYVEKLNKEVKDYSQLDFDVLSTKATEFYLQNTRDNPDADKRKRISVVALLTGYLAAIRAPVAEVNLNRWVIKQIGMEMEIERVLADFPQAKIIYLVRNPTENAYSRGVKRRRKDELLNGPRPGRHQHDRRLNYYDLTMWRKSVEHVEQCVEQYPGSILIVRYEDLIGMPTISMQDIAAFLEIEYMPALLEPTFMGSRWSGNSMRDQKFEAIANNPEVVVDPGLVELVSEICGVENLRRLGYHETDDASSRFYWPPRLISEPIHRYFFVRAGRFLRHRHHAH